MKNSILLSTLIFALSFSTNGFAQKSKIEKPLDNISRYPVTNSEDYPEDIQKVMLAVKEARGFVPNVLFALAHRPDEFSAFLAYNKAIMKKESGLSDTEKEMIVIATSNDNGCMYCVMSHGASLRMASKRPTIADQIAVNYHESDINPREKAMIDFAMKVSTDSKRIDENDFITLRKHGFSDEDIWDIAGITAFFGL